MDIETRCAVCQRPLVASEVSAPGQPVCRECQGVSEKPRSIEQPASADGLRPDHLDSPARSSADTLRFDQAPLEAGPAPGSSPALVPVSPESDDLFVYQVAESPEQNRSDERPVVATADADQARFGRFVIRGVLGQGAYGKVYRAFDPDLGREVALKILKRDVSHPEILRQLRQEARSLAQLRHRNIVRVFEDGLHGNEYYIVSRLVDAHPLSVVLAEERVSPRQAASWIRDVAEALAYAHKERILHRDVKPANILITSRLEALLADFGLALDLYDLNRASALYGTPAYMAPEQIAGDPTRIGPHSDQYSLAVVLYELLTGRRPYPDSGPGHSQIQPPTAGQMGPGVDRRLEAICLKGLSPLPVDRYSNLGAMADDLDRWLAGKKTQAKPRRLPLARALKRHAALLAALAVALVLAILLVVQWRRTTSTIARLGQDRLRVDGELNAKIGELDQKAREFNADRAEQAALFEKERASFRQPLAQLHLHHAETSAAAGDVLNACVHLAAALDRGEQSWHERRKQRVRDELAGLASGLIPVSQPSMWPRFGGPVPTIVVPELTEWLGIESDHPTRRWPATLRETHLAASGRELALAVAPNDEFAFLLPQSIWHSADGSLAKLAPDEPSGCSAAAFRPDGHVVLVAYGNSTIRFWDVTAGKPSGDFVRHPSVVKAAAFAPDGRSALAAGRDRVVRRIDPTTGSAGAELLRHPVGVERLWYRPDGKDFMTLGRDGIERQFDAETGAARGVPVAHEASVIKIASSPDGRTLLRVIKGKLPPQQSGQLYDREGRPLGHPFPMYSIREETRNIEWDGAAILAGIVRGPLLARLAILPEYSRSMRGGDSPVRFSRDGEAVLTVGLDGSLRLWDVASLEPRGPAFQASRSILDLTRDGKVAATRGPGDLVKFWSTIRGELIAALDTRGEPVSQLSFSSDGKLALTWSLPDPQFAAPARYEVGRWEIASGKPIGPSLSHGSRIRLAEFSPDGRTILTRGDQDDARLWDTATGRLIGSWPSEPTGSVPAVAFHPDGKTLATGGSDGTLQRWSTSTGLAAGPPLTVGFAIMRIVYVAKGRTLMTVSRNSTSLWDAETGRRLAPPLPAGGQGLFNEYTPHGAAVSPDGMRVLTKEPYTGRTRLWDATNGSPVGPPCLVEGKPVLSSDDGAVVLTNSAQGPRVWDLSKGTQRGTYYPFDDASEVVARSHDGKRILASLPSGPDPPDRVEGQDKATKRYRLLDATSSQPVGEPFSLGAGVAGLALGPDARILAVESLTGPDGMAGQAWTRLHDAASGKPVGQPLPGATTGFSPDGQMVLVGSVAWQVSLTNANDRLPRLGRSVRQVAFEPDGRTVVAVAEPAELRRCDLATGRVIDPISRRVERTILSLSPDGRLAVVGEGKIARLMQVETGREIGPPLDHSKPVGLASFAPDSKKVVTSERTSFQVWDASTGGPVGSPGSCRGIVVKVAMGPHGTIYVEESPASDAEWSHRHIVWKEGTSRHVQLPETRPGGVAAFSPDGRYLYVGGRHAGRLWDLSEDPPRVRPEPVAGEAGAKGVTAIAFRGDGRVYSVAHDDGTIEILEVATGRRIGSSRKPDQKVPRLLFDLFQHTFGRPIESFQNKRTATALAFSLDSHTLLIGFDDGLTGLWPAPISIPEHRVLHWLERRTAVRLMPDLTLKALGRDELLDQ